MVFYFGSPVQAPFFSTICVKPTKFLVFHKWVHSEWTSCSFSHISPVRFSRKQRRTQTSRQQYLPCSRTKQHQKHKPFKQQPDNWMSNTENSVQDAIFIFVKNKILTVCKQTLFSPKGSLWRCVEQQRAESVSLSSSTFLQRIKRKKHYLSFEIKSEFFSFNVKHYDAQRNRFEQEAGEKGKKDGPVYQGRPITWSGHKQGQRTRNSKRWALTLMKDYTQDCTQISSKQYEPSPRSMRQFRFHDQTPRKLKYCPQSTSGNVDFAITVYGQAMAAAKFTHRKSTMSGLVHMDDVIHSRINQASTVFGRPRSTM